MKARNILIMGAAGRDFHNFLTAYKDNPAYRVVAFTATQIPGIEKREFPKSLAGRLYSSGIPIYPEARLCSLIREKKVDEVVFSYSDVSSQCIMEKASLVSAAGADFVLLSPEKTMLESCRPVIAVCAVRTGSGKSPTTKCICRAIKSAGLKAVAVRHPMPYGDLEKQAVQRFSKTGDMKEQGCTIEEIEEYEGLVKEGITVYAGVDYLKILRMAEKEADVIVWDGGNNDFPFYRPDLFIVVADSRRPGHELAYYHGSVNARMADVIVINKVRSAPKNNVRQVEANIKLLNPGAHVIKADMEKKVDRPELIKGRKVLVIEDGPTLTHGGLATGAGYLAAIKCGAGRVIDPRPYASGSIREVFSKYPHLDRVLPAMGYGSRQIKELEKTINSVPCDSVVIGTPVDLGKYLKISKPVARVTYEIGRTGRPEIEAVVRRFLANKRLLP